MVNLGSSHWTALHAPLAAASWLLAEQIQSYPQLTIPYPLPPNIFGWSLYNTVMFTVLPFFHSQSNVQSDNKGYNRMSYVNYKIVKKTQTYILMLCKKLNRSLESEQSLSNSIILQKRPPNCYIKTVRLFRPKKTFNWV